MNSQLCSSIYNVIWKVYLYILLLQNGQELTKSDPQTLYHYPRSGHRQLRTGSTRQKEIRPETIRHEIGLSGQCETEIKVSCPQRNTSPRFHRHALCRLIQMLLLRPGNPVTLYRHGVRRRRRPLKQNQRQNGEVWLQRLRGKYYMENCLSTAQRAQSFTRAQHHPSRHQMREYFLRRGGS